MIPPEYIYLGDSRAITKLQDYPFIVDTRSLDLALPIIFGNTYEQCFMSLLLSKLPVGGVFVDCGANIGAYSYLAAHKLGKRGQVYAFEPNPRAASVLRANARLAYDFGGAPIDTRQVALSSRSGTSNLMYLEEFSAGAYVSNESNAKRNEPGWSNLSVTLCKWDDVFDDTFCPDLVKIDVEGQEVDLLLGARNLINSSQPLYIFMEACPDMWRGQGHDPEWFIEQLIRWDFRIAVVDASANLSDETSNPKAVVTMLDELAKSGYGGPCASSIFGHLLLQRSSQR